MKYVVSCRFNFCYFLLKDNQTTMIFGIRKQKKKCSQRCCFHLKREKLNKHVECAPIITKFGWLPVELQHPAGFIPGHMESPLSVPRSDSLIRPPANFGHGLTHFPWNFPTHFPSNSTKSCKIHTKITSYASYATCMVTFFWKKKHTMPRVCCEQLTVQSALFSSAKVMVRC